MANKFKYKSSSDNKVTVPFSSIGVDGSGQGSIGTREIISSNHVRITDVNSNTRQSHLIQGLSGDQEYKVSVEYLKITGTPTFRFQIQGYIGGSYVRTIKFTNTEETGLRDIDGWQTATWTFTLAGNENGVRIWWQDGADYTTYTHSFELKNPDLRISDSNSIFKGNWAIDTSAPNSGGGPSATTGLYNGAPIPNGGYTIYSPSEVYTAATDDDLLGKVRDLGGDYGSINAALTWIAGQPDIISLNKAFDNLVTDGLVLNLDASNISSFVDNKPTTNLLAAYNDGFVRSVWWTNSGYWDVNYNATNNAKPVIHGIDLSDVNLMYGRSITTGSQHFGCSNVGVISGETYTVSVWFFQNRSGTSHPYIRTSVNNNGLGYLTYNGVRNGSWPVNQWIRISATATVQANETGIYISNYIGSQVDDQVWYCAPQVELGTEMTAFAKGTRLQNTTLYDLSAGDRNGTLYNAPSFKSIGAISFDGVNDYSRVTLNGANLDDACTIEGTLRRNSIHPNWRTFFNIKPNGANYPFFEFRSSGGTPNIYGDYYIGSSEWSTPSATLNAGDFGHAVATHDGNGNMKMYLNGELIGTRTGVAALDLGVNPILQIGLAYSNDRPTDIDIAGIKIYNKAISETEVKQNYYKAPIVTDGLVFAVDAGNLVSYENNSTTAYNLAGSETGTLTNGVGFDSGNADSWTFDGTNDYIDITGLDSSYQVSAGSIEAWIKPSSDGSDQMVCGLGGGATLGATRLIRINGNQWSFVGYGSANQDWGNIAPVAFNTWVHIVIGWNGTALTFWLNGVEYNTTRSGIVTPNSSIIRLGVSPWNTIDRAFEGDIALMRMYSKLITSAEVTQNFNAQRNRFGI